MRRLLVSIFILGAFLGGYYLGRRENSPDILAWAQDAYPRFAEASEDLLDSLAPQRGGEPSAREQ